MGLGRDHDHLVRPRLRRGPDPGRQDDPHRPVVRQPQEPARPRTSRLRPAPRHPRPRRPLRRRRRAGQPAATDLAVHPRDEPVAGAPAPGRQRRAHRDEQGRHLRVGELAVTMVGADHSAGDWNRRRRDRPSTSASRPASWSAWRTASDLPRRRHERLRRHGADPRAVPAGPGAPADRRPLHDGPGRGGPRRGAAGRRHVAPIHWGTFPLLAGTPAALRDALDARGGSAEVIDWRPGDTVS